MTKADKKEIAAAFRDYNAAATLCSNVLYNESQNDTSEKGKQWAALVRSHDAKRNALATVLKKFGLVEGE